MKPLALDLFCCSGGSTVGLERAGFRVIGVDWKPSDHWTGAGELHQADLSTADAVEGVIRAFSPDFVSASPPCPRFSSATPNAARDLHPDLIASTREGMERAGVPGWIENVNGAPLHHSIRLCGTMFGLDVQRHRYFELLGWWVFEPEHPKCPTGVAVTVCGRGSNAGKTETGTPEYRELVERNKPGRKGKNWRRALGWMDGPHDVYSLAQAIPPAYTHFLGSMFLEIRR